MLRLINPNATLFLVKNNDNKDIYTRIKKYICSLYHLNYEEVIIKKTKTGKPYVLNCNIHISCSYSDNIVAFIISSCNIGIDIERIKTANDLIIKKIFCSDEADYVLSGNKDERFFIVWTMKEAYCKWTGNGLSDIKKVNVLDARSTQKFLSFQYCDFILSICWSDSNS